MKQLFTHLFGGFAQNGTRHALTYISRSNRWVARRSFALVLVAMASSPSWAAIILDDFTTATAGTGNSVQNADPGDGCAGPSSASNNGTIMFAAAGTRSMSLSRTSGAGTRCVQAVVDQAGTFNDLQMNSDPGTSGTLTVTGSGSNYTWLSGDTGVSFRAAHTLQTLVPATVQVFLRIAGGGFVGAAPVTITTGTLSQFLIGQPSFNIGGTIAAGTTIDGYQLILTGGQASGLVLDDLEIVGGVPEPSVLLTLTLGLGLLGISARRFRAA